MNAFVELSSTQKAATILLVMGKERAAKVIAQCDADEIRSLMAASNTLKHIEEEQLEALVAEFEKACNSNSGMLETSGSLQDIIDEALTPEQKEALSVGPGAAEMALRSTSIWDLMDQISQDDLIEFLLTENQQISAFILSNLPSKKSAEIVGLLEPEIRQGILASMITSRTAIPEAVNMIEDVLKERFSRSIGVKADSGGSKRLAGMFNELDSDLSDNLFEELAEVVKPQNLQKVKSLMFRFEDIPTLDKTDIAKIVDEVDQETMTNALRDAQPLILDLILGSMGQRTRRMMESELSSPTTIPPETIKAARKSVSSAVLGLASLGVITIPEADVAA